MANAHIAKLMWDAYAIQAGGKTFDGKPLPSWDELGDERQSCWIAAASVTADRIEKLEAALHRISLGSQNSGATKEGLGREARKALEGEND